MTRQRSAVFEYLRCAHCHPTAEQVFQAVRPHIQEGYLLGQYPEVTGIAERENYFHYEMDFGLRLVAKFCFEPASFWKDGNFPKVSKSALYPSPKDDPLYQLALDVQKEVGKE